MSDGVSTLADVGVCCLYGHHQCDCDAVYQSPNNVARFGANNKDRWFRKQRQGKSQVGLTR
eukprot:9019349-Prorocentrum_lima.AAC.1